MRICVQTATGKLVEMQTDATAGTLIDNAVAAGYVREELEEQEVDAAGYAAVLAAQPGQPTEKDLHNADIDAQIDTLERGALLPRGVREFILPSMVKIGTDLGLTEEQLYAQQPGYKRLKDFDDQIKALRAQRLP